MQHFENCNFRTSYFAMTQRFVYSITKFFGSPQASSYGSEILYICGESCMWIKVIIF